jgi:1-phosphofructokinase family hexose kinase
MRPVLLTVTPNPSLDVFFDADRFVWDDANRVDQPRRRPGGQGINAVRAALALREHALAVALLGGSTGRELAQNLAAEGTPFEPVWVEGETRTFIALHERDTGRSLLVNPRGVHCGRAAEEALIAAIETRLESERPYWVACCGSVPPGMDPAIYARIGAAVRRSGAGFVADCDGDALRFAAEAGCDLLTPNIHEAERLIGASIRGVDEAAVAAARIAERYRLRLVALKLGAQGAVAVTEHSAWHAADECGSTGSAVGAGDAFLAALLIALTRNEPTPDALRSAVAAGTAVLFSDGSDIVTFERYRLIRDRVRVRALR